MYSLNFEELVLFCTSFNVIQETAYKLLTKGKRIKLVVHKNLSKTKFGKCNCFISIKS